MFVLAEMWGLRPDGSNPRKHIRKYPEEKRERFLSAAELRRIGEVLREMESERVELSSAILAARLLILTGCRLGEIMTLKWDYIDFHERALRLPDSKTGKKIVHLGAPAVEYLRDAQRIDGNGRAGDRAKALAPRRISHPLASVVLPGNITTQKAPRRAPCK
jgi:integrase